MSKSSNPAAGDGTRPPDRFEHVAAGYDRWIGWGPRLEREMPFLLASLPERPTDRAAGAPALLDVGCGTGAHAIALAAAGYDVIGLDQSPAMLEEARRAEATARADGRLRPEARLHWQQGDITDPGLLAGRAYQAVLAIGNSLLALGDEALVLRGLHAMLRSLAPGGTLILQYLNGTRIRREGRLAVKAADADLSPESGSTDPGAPAPRIWLRHHFEAGGSLHFHSYVLRREAGVWKAAVQRERLVDLPPQKVLAILAPRFEHVEALDGLSERAFSAEASDAVGIRARGAR